jgi:hypothetical protein
VALRFNDLRVSIRALYRLFIAGIYLKNVKVPHKGTAHNYPMMILSYLLILEYWRGIDHVSIKMMKDNTMIVDEELGELCFSVLGRCVLGDTCKSNFEHISKMFKLLPIYREVRDEIAGETRSSSIAWRHKVTDDCDEVKSASLFFKRLIKQVMDKTYKSYDGSPSSFNSAQTASTCLTTRYTPVIVIPQVVVDELPKLYAGIESKLCGSWLKPHKDMWPEAADEDDNDSDDDTDETMESQQQHAQGGVGEWGPPWTECVVGHYAVARVSGNDGDGIEVFKIQEINEQLIEDGVPYNNFTGYQRNCTLGNVVQECVRRGRWNYDVNNRTSTQVVKQYEVIAFFPKFAQNCTLPTTAVNDIKLVQEMETLFIDRRRQQPHSDDEDNKHN